MQRFAIVTELVVPTVVVAIRVGKLRGTCRLRSPCESHMGDWAQSLRMKEQTSNNASFSVLQDGGSDFVEIIANAFVARPLHSLCIIYVLL